MTLIRLTDHGAVSDAHMIEDGAMVSGSPTLTSASGPFTAGDVGKAIVVAGAGAAGAKLKTSVAAYVSATQLTLAANAATTVASAGVAWGTDCSAALQAAVAETDANRGGSISVDGYFLLTEPVSRAFVSTLTSSAVNLLGTGTDSAIIVAVDSNETAITLSGAAFSLESIAFVGVPDATDAGRVLDVADGGLEMERCQFLGLLTTNQVVRVLGSFKGSENSFGGSFILTDGIEAAVHRSVLYVDDWSAFEDNGSQFIDYGYWRGLQLGKSDMGAVSAWVGVGTPIASHLLAGSRFRQVVTFRGTGMDEGSLAGIWVEPETGTIPALELIATGHNVSASGPSSGINAKSVDNVLIDRCTFGLADSSGTAFGRFEDCGRVEVNSVRLLQGVDKIVATNVDALVVRDTEIDEYSLTGTGFYPQSSAAGGLALIKAGAITDADFPAPPGPGATAFDRTNGRFYLRARGDWVYFTMAGGSLLGPELVPNGSGGSTAGWTPNNSVLSSVSGKLRVTINAAYGNAIETFPVQIGTAYVFSIVVVGGAAGSVVRVGRSPGGGEYAVVSASTTTTFTAAGSTDLYITLTVNSETVGAYAEFKNISVRAA